MKVINFRPVGQAIAMLKEENHRGSEKSRIKNKR